MPEYLSPGVYIEELPGPQSIQGVGTSTTGMVGVTKKGPTEGKPELVTSFAEFVTRFGGPYSVGRGRQVDPAMVADWVFNKGGRWWLASYAVQGFFDNGGQRLFFKRVVASSALPAASTLDPLPIESIGNDGVFVIGPAPSPPAAPPPAGPAPMRLRIEASSAGLWGDGMTVKLTPAQGRRLSVSSTAANGGRETTTTTVRAEQGNQTVEIAPPVATGAVVAKIADELHDATVSGTTLTLTTGKLRRAYPIGTVVELRLPVTVAPAAPELDIRGFGSAVPGGSTKAPVYAGALVLFRPATKRLSDLGDDNRFVVASWDNDKGSVTLGPRAPGAALPAALQVFTGDEVILVEARIEIDYEDQETGSPISEAFGPLRLIDSDSEELGEEGRFDTVVSEESRLVNVIREGEAVHWDSFPGTGPDGLKLAGGDDALADLDPGAFVGTDAGGGRRTGIKSLEDVDEIAICAAPGIWALEVHSELIAHCEILKDRFAVLDPADSLTVQEVLSFREPLDSSYAALYHPWLQVREPRTRKVIAVPPSGHVAGIYGRNDTERGVHKAPANEVVRSITGLADDINKREQDLLNPLGINALRLFPNRGFRVWGGRTLSSVPEWRYINVRRLFIFIEESINEGTQWAVFEPNGPDLWARVRQTVANFLDTQWRIGALLGNSREEAFYVVCDRTTMSEDDLANGRLIVEVGIAPVRPAEFVIFRFRQKTLEPRAA